MNMKQLALACALAISALLAACGGGGSSTSGGGTPPPVGAATKITLTSSVNPVDVGQATVLTATVTGASPTGTVTFSDGSTILGTSTLASGTATLSATLSAGTRSLGAAYGGDANNAPSTSASVSETVNALLTTPQPSPFAAGSIEAQTWDELTRIRIAGGFGAPIYDEVMTKAAANHVQYVLAKALTGLPGEGHGETVGVTGFTGVDPQARCVAAAVGTTGQGKMSCSEVIGGTYARDGNVGLMGLFTLATGHMQTILSFNSNRFGMNFMPFPDKPGWSYNNTGTVDLGHRTDAPVVLSSAQANSIVGVYPFPSQTGVGIGLVANTGTGLIGSGYALNILVQPSSGGNPVVTAFTLRKQGDTVDTPTAIHVAGTYSGTEPTFPGWSILLPTVVLDQNTIYTVTYAATINGTPVSKTWSFTTGTSAYSRAGG